MKAIVQDRYGTPEVLEFSDIDEPVVGEGDVLVRVHAAGCGPDVWHFMAGKPYLARLMIGFRGPKVRVRGWDVAGTVEAVGANVTRFKAGDDVMGTCEAGSFAELAVTPQDKLVPKPARLTFEEAAAMPVSGCTAFQALRDVAQRAAGAEGAGDRGVRRCRFARGADREGARRRCHRRVQHQEAGPGPLARRRRRDRLHGR